MKAFTALTTAALLGTERRAPEWPDEDGDLGTLLASLPREVPEKALLQAAGVFATCQLAGWKPPLVESTVAPATIEAAAPALPAVSQHTLDSILEEGPLRLQAEALHCLTATGRALPHRLLPKALDVGRRSIALRPFLLPVLGARGTWLAAQNPAWAYATGDHEDSGKTMWETGSLDQRRLYLTNLRSVDPATARDLIASATPTEGARERAAFIECLVVSLSLRDEDLLEATLSDKGKDVRQAAARLLSSLPGSRFMQRMEARLEPCLALEKRFLRGTVATLEAPSAFQAEWKADLLEEAKPKGHAMGERAWWLFQIVRAVPLAWWQDRTLMTPGELLAWARKTDWSDALLQGWAAAQALQQRTEWTEAFLATDLPAGTPLNVSSLLRTLPQAARESHFLRLFQNAGGTHVIAGHALLDDFLAGLPLDAPPLSLETARQVLRVLKQRLSASESRYDWSMRSTLVELACALPLAAFDEAASGWGFDAVPQHHLADAIARVALVLDQRRQLLNLKPASE